MTSKFRITRRGLGIILLVSGTMMLMTPVYAVDANTNFLRLVANKEGARNEIPFFVKRDGPVREARVKSKPHSSPKDPKEFTTDFRIEDCTLKFSGPLVHAISCSRQSALEY